MNWATIIHFYSPIFSDTYSCLKRRVIHGMVVITAIVFTSSQSRAQEPGTIPQAYPLDRYESGWNTNPFTLKTAPVAIKTESFAKDMALGSMYKVGDVTTVVLVNTKTRDRIKLSSNEVSGDGMRIKSATILDSRRDSYAEIEKGSETAVMRYDLNLLKQLSAQGAAANVVTAGNGASEPSQNMNMAGLPGAIPQQPAREPAQPPIPANGVGALNTDMNFEGQQPQPPPIGGIMQPPTTPGGVPAIPGSGRRRILTAPTPTPSPIPAQ